MGPACLRFTEIPATSKLFQDFLYHPDRVRNFYPDPHPAQIDYPARRRAALVDALREINGDSPQLKRLAEPDTVAIVTGQQVGLFSGPCYSIYKALTAAKLAAGWNARGIPAVPIFWMATEDHDAAEVNHCYSFDGVYRMDTGAANDRVVGAIPLVNPPLNQLRSALSEFPYGDEVAALVEAAYAPGQTLGSAFQALVKRLLEPYGFLFVDPLHPGIRNLAAPFLQTAYEQSASLHNALLERNRDLESAGYHAQVKVDAKSSLFFKLENGRRVRLRRDGAVNAAQLSPNALLRPVMQDYLLPTAAYIGGPAEIAYLAQSKVLYDHLLDRMPLVFARRGFTLLDSRAAKLFHRYSLSLCSFFGGPEQLRDEVANQLVPAELDSSLGQTRERVDTLLSGLRGELNSFDPTLAAALDTSSAKIRYQLQKIQKKAAHEALRRNERASSETDFLIQQVYPHNHLQERYYTILPFLAKHGLDLIPQLYENVHLDCPDHIVLPV